MSGPRGYKITEQYQLEHWGNLDTARKSQAEFCKSIAEIISHCTSEQTAWVVQDYPYGFKLKTTMACWIEYKPGNGYRFVTRTQNPKNGRWNAEKPSTYVKQGFAFMYTDKENGHVKWSAWHWYPFSEEAQETDDYLIAALREAFKDDAASLHALEYTYAQRKKHYEGEKARNKAKLQAAKSIQPVNSCDTIEQIADTQLQSTAGQSHRPVVVSNFVPEPQEVVIKALTVPDARTEHQNKIRELALGTTRRLHENPAFNKVRVEGLSADIEGYSYIKTGLRGWNEPELYLQYLSIIGPETAVRAIWAQLMGNTGSNAVVMYYEPQNREDSTAEKLAVRATLHPQDIYIKHQTSLPDSKAKHLVVLTKSAFAANIKTGSRKEKKLLAEEPKNRRFQILFNKAVLELEDINLIVERYYEICNRELTVPLLQSWAWWLFEWAGNNGLVAVNCTGGNCITISATVPTIEDLKPALTSALVDRRIATE